MLRYLAIAAQSLVLSVVYAVFVKRGTGDLA